MPHLFKFRKGWRSEHLAKFILSKFSFIAEPSTVADDLGSDFFCTLFKIEADKYLMPQNSFAIQIKSNKNKYDITNKVSYFKKLEIPFFLGVVNTEALTMRVYSGESLPHFFSMYTGKVENEGFKATIRYLEDEDYDNRFHNFIDCDNEKKECYLDFPKVLELDANYDYKLDPTQIDDLFYICSLIQFNLSSKNIGSYLFFLYGHNGVNVYSGPDSIVKYKENYYRRLIEVFTNLKFIFDNNPEEFDYEEFEMHKSTYENLIKKYDKKGGVLEKVFIELDEKVKEQKSK